MVAAFGVRIESNSEGVRLRTGAEHNREGRALCASFGWWFRPGQRGALSCAPVLFCCLRTDFRSFSSASRSESSVSAAESFSISLNSCSVVFRWREGERIEEASTIEQGIRERVGVTDGAGRGITAAQRRGKAAGKAAADGCGRGRGASEAAARGPHRASLVQLCLERLCLFLRGGSQTACDTCISRAPTNRSATAGRGGLQRGGTAPAITRFARVASIGRGGGKETHSLHCERALELFDLLLHAVLRRLALRQRVVEGVVELLFAGAEGEQGSRRRSIEHPPCLVCASDKGPFMRARSPPVCVCAASSLLLGKPRA